MWRRDIRAGALIAGLLAAGLPAAAAAEPLSLAEAVKRATVSTAGVQAADLRTREAQARAGQARASLLPSLSGTALDGQRTFNLETFGIAIPVPPGTPPPANPVGPVDDFDARFAASQSLIDFSSWRRLHSAQAGVGVNAADARAVAQGAAQAAAVAYVRAVRAAATVEARQADLEIADQLDSLARTQLAAGTAADIDVVRSRTQSATARGQLLVARNELARARIDLARAVGADPATTFEPSDTLTGAVRSDAPEEEPAALALALQRRADLIGQRARVERARLELGAIQAERVPKLVASADYGLSGLHADDALTTYTLGLALTMPIFDGLRREERVREQRLTEREAAVQASDLERQVQADVRASLLALASGLEQQDIAQERVALAEQELTQARERFVGGVAGNIEVINAQSSLVHARDADIDARTATAIARISLARAVGVAETVR